MKYYVTVVERIEYVVEVDADSFEEASDKGVDAVIKWSDAVCESEIYACSLNREDGEFVINV